MCSSDLGAGAPGDPAGNRLERRIGNGRGLRLDRRGASAEDPAGLWPGPRPLT